MSETEQPSDVAALTVQLLSAYLANNSVESGELADLIRTTRAALTGEVDAAEPVEAETFTPAVSVRKSLASSEHILSLIDGRPYKTLKRHLASHGLTPDTYRARYNLPASYPMVAPDYAAHRRAVAQKVGLGTRKPAPEAAEPDSSPETVNEAAPSGTTTEQGDAAKAPAAKKPSRRASKKAAEPSQDSAAEAQAPEAQSPEPSSEPDTAEASPPAPKSRKRPAQTRKASKAKADDTGSAASEPAQPVTDAPPAEATSSDATLETAKPKRRGRIGLFKAESAPAEPQGDNPEASDQAKSAANSEAKSKKAPRMAREPKSARAAAAGAKSKSS
ncbi:MucR family transcriptional regulator [Novosphingobium sp. 9U]|uniref:MucR family transcriptional regulator n=1 Tax=Novosphingobium sp. 9U TaxID=2653158 RepID=UPI0012F0869B|nr:MucR family transcriptional regulator [Novosphingobium sp. 9U]VWX47203.1 Transcriptional regulator [Novosphingobium sp. 9U]